MQHAKPSQPKAAKKLRSPAGRVLDYLGIQPAATTSSEQGALRPFLAALGQDVVGGSISALISLSFSLSFAAMIFAGDLIHDLGYGIRMSLTSAVNELTNQNLVSGTAQVQTCGESGQSRADNHHAGGGPGHASKAGHLRGPVGDPMGQCRELGPGRRRRRQGVDSAQRRSQSGLDAGLDSALCAGNSQDLPCIGELAA